MRVLVPVLLCAALLFSLCACGGPEKYTADTFAFDTVINLTAYCDSEEQFQQLRTTVFGRIQELHKKYDIFNEYQGLNNLCTVNRLAGQPVEVDEDIIGLLDCARDVYTWSDGLVNIAQGNLFALWREARETAVLPGEAFIREAMAYGDMEQVMWSRGEGTAPCTVTLKDPNMTLDVGAVAKGYAAQQAAEAAGAMGYTNYVISAGGNVVVRGMVGDRPWNVGIRDPLSADSSAYCMVVEASNMALVTSGGYERNLVVDGRTYCHIIDPRTGYPADIVLSATAICPDSGLADGFSTTLFLMEPEEAMTFAKAMGFRAIIVDHNGTVWDSQAIQ